MEETLELEEHYEGGRCVKRLINGVEVPEDTFASAIQFAPHVITKTKMTYEEARHRYGDLVPTPPTTV